jgi:hypothetical protein
MKHLCMAVAARPETHHQIGAHYGLVQYVLLSSPPQEIFYYSILLEYKISYINTICHFGEFKYKFWRTMLLNQTI